MSGSDLNFEILFSNDLIISIVPSVDEPSMMIYSISGYVCAKTELIVSVIVPTLLKETVMIETVKFLTNYSIHDCSSYGLNE